MKKCGILNLLFHSLFVMKDMIEGEKQKSEQVENFLEALKILARIDFQKFPKLTNQERFQRVSKMFNSLSQKDKELCMYEYSFFLEKI